jgi:hypothetical protein
VGTIPAGAGLAGLLLVLAACSPPSGRLELRVTSGGAATPARIELLDAEGEAQVAPDGLEVVLECLVAPPPEWLLPAITSREIFNLYTGTTQFYVAGTAALELAPGPYELRVFKGNEFRTVRRTLEIVSGESLTVDVPLERWTDPAAAGWISSDDHIHLCGPRGSASPICSRWGPPTSST